MLPSFDLDDPLVEQPALLPVGSTQTSSGSHIAERLPHTGAPPITPPDPSAQIPGPYLTMSSGVASGFDVRSFPVGEGEGDVPVADEDEVCPSLYVQLCHQFSST